MTPSSNYKTPFSDPKKVAQADKALFLFKEVADALGLEWCLFAGTALGFFRDRKYIPWDNDIDIALLKRDDDELQALSDALYAVGFNVGRDCVNNDGTQNRHFFGGMEEDHSEEDGVLVDVFHTFTEEEMQYLYAFDAVVYKDDLFPLPGPIQSYLMHTYGGSFMVPDKEKKAKYEPARAGDVA